MFVCFNDTFYLMIISYQYKGGKIGGNTKKKNKESK